MTNLAEKVSQNATTFPDRPALRLGATTLKCPEFDDLAGRAGECVALSGGEQDRAELTAPATSSFSWLDGIVSREAWQDLIGALLKNLEIVLDRPRQPVGAWRQYDARVAT